MTARLDVALAELAAAIREEVQAESHAAQGAPDRLLSIREAAAAMGIGRSALYGELAAGRLRSLKVGRRRLVAASALAERLATPNERAAEVATPTATANARSLARRSHPRNTADDRPRFRAPAPPLDAA